MLLPKYSGLHPTRSLHRGKHLQKYSIDIAEEMSRIVKSGKLNNWNQQRYNEELMDFLMGTRSKLKQGNIPLNNLKK